MKKMVKTVACLTAALSLCATMTVNTSAYTVDGLRYPSCFACWDFINEDGSFNQDVIDFILESEPKCNLKDYGAYRRECYKKAFNWDSNPYELDWAVSTDDCYIYTINWIGYDENGHNIYTSDVTARWVYLEETDTYKIVYPGDIIKTEDVICDDGSEITLEYRYEYADDPNGYTEATVIGFDEVNNPIIGNRLDVIVRFDDEGQPQPVTLKKVSVRNSVNVEPIFKTIDLNTGEEILVRAISYYNIGEKGHLDVKYCYDPEAYEKWQAGETNINSDRRIPMGDTNGDGEIDIRDITVMNKHVVGLEEIPDYMNIVSDINADGSVDVKDLGQLKKYIIKLVDKL